jgi:hypothetical protein
MMLYKQSIKDLFGAYTFATQFFISCSRMYIYTAAALFRAVGTDLNLVQMAYYNGHYGFFGTEVQHVLQADGTCYYYTCPLC